MVQRQNHARYKSVSKSLDDNYSPFGSTEDVGTSLGWCGTREGGRIMGYKDLTGMTFGHMEVLYRNGSNKRRQALWRCKCRYDGRGCIGEKDVTSEYLTNKKAYPAPSSCGCYAREQHAIFCGTLA